MDYEQKYKEALERAKAWKEDRCMPTDTNRQGVLEDIFPELKESEDEKIGKEIISFIKKRDRCGCDYDYDKWIAWLEKQGEQMPADNVEPKFKVGDWVIQGCNILKIRCVGDEYYCYETVGGYVDDVLVSEIDSLYHLWTIQDAKDGDVLVASDNSIFIFKEVLGTSCKHYIALTSDNEIQVNTKLDGFWETTRGVKPAFKEQRDHLFQKMKKAGYEWDAGNKQLRKIEKQGEKKPKKVSIWKHWKDGIAGGAADEQVFLQKIGRNYCISSCLGCECDYIELSELDKLMREEKQGKPKWSEEDENMLDECIDAVDQCEWYPFDRRKKMENWLKSLKKRLEGQQ